MSSKVTRGERLIMSAAEQDTHPAVRHPFDSLNNAVANRVTSGFGSMRMFLVLFVWQAGWMILASFGVGVFAHDRYPFPFLLFLSNLFQLLALPILGWVTNWADKKRQAKADADHEALTHIANQVDAIAAAVAGGVTDEVR